MQRCQIEKQITKVAGSRLEWTLMIRHGHVWIDWCGKCLIVFILQSMLKGVFVINLPVSHRTKHDYKETLL